MRAFASKEKGRPALVVTTSLSDETLRTMFKVIAKRIANEQDPVRVHLKALAPVMEIHESLSILSADDWHGPIVRSRWKDFKEHHRIDVLSGVISESTAYQNAERRLYLALNEADLYRFKERLTQVLSKDYLDTRSWADASSPVSDLELASKKLGEIEATTVKKLAKHLPELATKIAKAPVPTKFHGSNRQYPRYLYYRGPDAEDARLAWVKAQLQGIKLEDNEFIVVIERFAPDREVRPPSIVQPYCTPCEGAAR